LCQPSSSQSKTTQTRSSSLGSRKTCAPLDPCCFRFSAPLVEKVFQKRSKLICLGHRGRWLRKHSPSPRGENSERALVPSASPALLRPLYRARHLIRPRRAG